VADPKSLTEFADREVADLKAALLTATAAVTSSRAALLAADSALKAAADDLAKANAKLAEIRRKLALIGMPADGEPLLTELRDAIIDQRGKVAALAIADLAQAKAAARLAQAQSLLPALQTRLSAAEAAAKAAADAKKRRDKAIAEIAAEPLKDINQAATDALASPEYAAAKMRIEGALPAPLRGQAAARSQQALDAVGRAEARQAAARAESDGLAEETGLATDTLPRLKRMEAGAEADLLRWVDGVPRRMTTAVAALKRLATLNAPPLTAEQKASIDADATARGKAAQAEEKWDAARVKVEDTLNALEIKRLELHAADPDVDTSTAEADPTTAIGKLREKWDKATADFGTEDGKFTAAMRTAMARWRAAVPDSLWLEAEAFLAADADLKQLKTASAAPLVAALKNAEAGELAALIDDAKRRRRLDWLAPRLAAETSVAVAARSRADEFWALAFSGYPTVSV